MFAPVSISTEAIDEIKNILEKKGIPEGYGLRVGVKGGGCGVSFQLGFDQPKDGDIEYDVDGVPVMIQKRETMFLVGKRIDFYNQADGRGFAFVDDKPISQESQ